MDSCDGAEQTESSESQQLLGVAADAASGQAAIHNQTPFEAGPSSQQGHPQPQQGHDHTPTPMEMTRMIRCVLSLDTRTRAKIHMLDGNTLVAAAGCVVLLLHLQSGAQRFIPSVDGGGIAAIAVHKDRQALLVAENGRSTAPSMCVCNSMCKPCMYACMYLYRLAGHVRAHGLEVQPRR